MIPFLKNQQEASPALPDDVKVRKPDEEPGFEMLDAIVADIVEALPGVKVNKSLLKSALEALVDHIKEEDEIQDMAMES